MKIIKPMRLGVMPRPFTWQKKHFLCVTAYAHVTLGSNPQLLNEQGLWPMLASEVGNTSVLDLGMPKQYPEFLVSGFGYTHHQHDKTRCAVAAQVGHLEKRLTVFGDRYWIAGGASAPAPFDAMPLAWTHAFGGAACAANPLGRGMDADDIGGEKAIRLPNIELAGELYQSPGRPPSAPAGMGPIDIAWQQRQARMGVHDQHWLDNDFPGLAPTMDWRAWNAAPDDQHFPASFELAGAPYTLRNMHPEHPLLSGTIPDWVGRCLVVKRQNDKQITADIDLRLSTAWFFPHRLESVLIYHGVVEIGQDDAHDVVQLMPALEHRHAKRDHAHFLKVLEQRIDPKTGSNYAFRDGDLLPDGVALGLLFPGEDTMFDKVPGPLERNQRQRMQNQRDKSAQMAREEGLNPDDILPPMNAAPELPRRLEDLPQFMEKVDRLHAADMDQARATLATTRREMASNLPPEHQGQLAMLDQLAPLLDSDAGVTRAPVAPTHSFAEVSASHAHMAAMGKTFPETPVPEIMPATELKAKMHKMYLHGVTGFAPAAVLVGDAARRMRDKVAAIYASTRDFTGLDLTGADLSGMDLRGANFGGAMLESADLRGATLDDCNFAEAILARTSLAGASFAHARCDGTSLAQADARHASFAHAVLNKCAWEDAKLDHGDFSHARIGEVMLTDLQIESANFDDARFFSVTFYKVGMRNCSFLHAQFEKCVFIEGQQADLCFDKATLQDCAWVTTAAARLSFRGTVLRTCAVTDHTALDDADFTDAQLSQCNFREISMQRANFSGATAAITDFSEANLTGANLQRMNASGSFFTRSILVACDLRDANLIGASLVKADLRSCDLRGANLFRADLAQTLGDGGTLFDQAYLEQTKFLPRLVLDTALAD
ncbi:DUF2169 domain-containing protein [Massilia sp. P8910]|uniref:DUF2169 family type VI secretion system accessory protein n=1 Tax=Massilia antarctica TaxID=2765360 RepID=UPI001E618296|nr:DUF2169 domain-containing protein [Massilia antarctica]MCE3605334.1 DUF2169 domain-containing protein [Massilia antarctica]